ncbi:hypothetical protein EUTSA_v10015286mg [Eutrema salsugineum]|uniref:DUF868 domain-containing protein n=1 Tax=Eutrema salsugineum TaxID=72664 RepID=V4LF95_EUTSA|nr:uncharacterized protein LOC18019094 [Eutrema salsugineum]ESQ41052.1 hypothetical protein EUTSA_v10015286mg [Eutrema salsugineum]
MSPSRQISAWLRPSSDHNHPPPPSQSPSSPLVSGDPNLTTCLYQTDHGVFYLTWSRTFLGGHSLNLFLHSQDYYNHSSPLSFSSADLSLSSAVSFHLNLNTLAFWRKRGSRFVTPNIQVFWDLTRAKFDSGSEPRSGFYIAVVVDGEMGLLVGDSVKEAYARAKEAKPPTNPQALLLRKEHVFGARVFSTKARFGGKSREISIDCRVDEDARLCFNVDSKQVLQIKRLRWKFRGNEKVEIDGVPVQISWDVYNWLFQSKSSGDGGHAVFMFRFESDPEAEELCETKRKEEEERNGNGVVLWKPKECRSSLGIKGIVEWRKMRKRFVKSKRSSSSSSISMSSASSACSSSVLEWASSADEAEYGGGGSAGSGSGNGLGFSLLVYAWIK